MNIKEFNKLFLSETRTTEHERQQSNFPDEQYFEIYQSYLATRADFEDVGEAYAKLLQRIPEIHSVRWRTKDPISLIDKIIRKRAENSEKKDGKYWGINSQNYRDIITDLVGIRALYLFKDQISSINSELIAKLGELTEPPIYYCRDGDINEDEEHRLKENGFAVKPHPAGYRSIHYTPRGGIDRSNPITFEIQVRSLNDEAWSEVDHKIRYPNFDKNPLIEKLLQILNRLSGSADEMSNFIKLLSRNLKEQSAQLAEIDNEKTGAISKLEAAIQLLENKKNDVSSETQLVINEVLKKLRDVEKNPALRSHSKTYMVDYSDSSVFDRLNAIIAKLSI